MLWKENTVHTLSQNFMSFIIHRLVKHLESCLSIQTNLTLSLSLSLSLRKDRLANPPIYFFNNPLEEVQSFKLLGLTISHDLSWANHISKLDPKASHRLVILCRSKSFLSTPERQCKIPPTTNKVFICSIMEYWSHLWSCAPASNPAQLDAMETKGFKVIGISHDEGFGPITFPS